MIDSDTKLLIKAQKGDKSAFQKLFDAYYQKGISVAYKILENMEDSEDIVMDSFLDMYNLEINKDIVFSSYFLRVVLNNSLNFVNKNKRIVHDFDIDLLSSPNTNTEKELEQEETIKEIFEKLNQLPDTQRQAFILVKYEGHSYEEAAKIMNTTVKAVEGYMFRARKKINELFNINEEN